MTFESCLNSLLTHLRSALAEFRSENSEILWYPRSGCVWLREVVKVLNLHIKIAVLQLLGGFNEKVLKCIEVRLHLQHWS